MKVKMQRQLYEDQLTRTLRAIYYQLQLALTGLLLTLFSAT